MTLLNTIRGIGVWWKPIAGVGALVALLFAWSSGSLQDYPHYVNQWDAATSAADPWAPTLRNAYGPGFLVMAPFAELHELVPKVLFVLVWFGMAWYILMLSGANVRPYQVVLLILNPFLWVEIAYFGHFDIVIAALILLAVICIESDRPALAGVALGAGFVAKYYPAVVVPFVSRDWSKISVGFVLSSIAGLVMTLWLWGTTFLETFRYGTTRNPSLLSPFRTIRAANKLVFEFEFDFDMLSLPMVVIGLAGLYWYTRRLQLSAPVGALTSLLVVLAFYKVGHPQFHIPVVVLLAYFFARRPESLRVKSVAWAASSYLVFLAGFNFLYMFIYAADQLEGTLWHLVTSGSGVPFFLIEAWLIWSLLRFEARFEEHQVRRTTANIP